MLFWAGLAIYGLVIAIAVWKVFTRRGRAAIGAGAAGAFYDMLSQDRREAVHVVAEKKAEKQDPEDRDGNLPDLSCGRDHVR
jgi:hypothetical protein